MSVEDDYSDYRTARDTEADDPFGRNSAPGGMFFAAAGAVGILVLGVVALALIG